MASEIINMLLIEIKGQCSLKQELLSSPLEPLNREQQENLAIWSLLNEVERIIGAWNKKIWRRNSDVSETIERVQSSLI